MCPQQGAVAKVKCIVHSPGWVVAWNIECREVVVVVFNLAAGNNLIARPGKDILYAVHSLSYWVQATECRLAARQCHVYSIRREGLRQFLLLQLVPAPFDVLLQCNLGFINQGTNLRAFCGV